MLVETVQNRAELRDRPVVPQNALVETAPKQAVLRDRADA